MSALSVPSPLASRPLGGLLARIGNTPMVRLRQLTTGVVPDAVEVWVKCEWFNPGGSVKARAALANDRLYARNGRQLVCAQVGE